MDEKQVRKIVKEEITKGFSSLTKDIKGFVVVQERLIAGQERMVEKMESISKKQDRLQKGQDKMMEKMDFLVGEAKRQREKELAGNDLGDQQEEKSVVSKNTLKSRGRFPHDRGEWRRKRKKEYPPFFLFGSDRSSESP